jgi:hypothetical protein
MKTTFSKEEIHENKGCYSHKQVNSLSFINNNIITIKDILKSKISINDKCWFVYNNCDLSLDEKRKLTLKLAWCVLPIYEKEYPNDSRVRDCLQAVEDFNAGKLTLDELKEAHSNIHVANCATNSNAAYYMANAVYAANVNTDVYTANAVYYAANIAADATNADAYAANGKSKYFQKLQQILIDFIK